MRGRDPDCFIAVDRIPLNVNGKTDRSRLAHLSESDARDTADFVGARNAIEDAICRAWERAIGRPVSVYDNFFEIGGDSIRAIQVVTLVSKSGFLLEPNQIFRHQTVAELSEVCRRKEEMTKPDVSPPPFELDRRRLDQLGVALAKMKGTE